MTGLFQKVNHLGKSELISSAGYVTEKDKKKYCFPHSLRLITYTYFKWRKKHKKLNIHNLTIKT